MKIQSLELILRQILFQNLLNVNANKDGVNDPSKNKGDILIEMYFQNRYENFDIFSKFINIKERDAERFDIYVNIS